MTVPTRVEFTFRRAGKIVAFADVVYGDFLIRDFKVIESNLGDGFWVGMPSKKYLSRDGQREDYISTAWIPDRERRKAFEDFVLAAFAKETQARDAAAA